MLWSHPTPPVFVHPKEVQTWVVWQLLECLIRQVRWKIGLIQTVTTARTKATLPFPPYMVSKPWSPDLVALSRIKANLLVPIPCIKQCPPWPSGFGLFYAHFLSNRCDKGWVPSSKNPENCLGQLPSCTFMRPQTVSRYFPPSFSSTSEYFFHSDQVGSNDLTGTHSVLLITHGNSAGIFLKGTALERAWNRDSNPKLALG